jgi:ribokinase
LSSLGEHAKDLHFELAAYLDAHPTVQLAFQPGTFQIKMGATALASIYKKTNFFCCNLEESQKILGTELRDLPTLLAGIENLGPKIICITDGKNGAYLRFNGENYFMPIYPDQKAPYERTGAGDAFTSSFTAALILGLSPLEAIRWAPINSMNVVQYIGAQKGLLSRPEIERLLAAAPADYVPVKI